MFFTSKRLFQFSIFLVSCFLLLLSYKKFRVTGINPIVLSGVTMGTYYRLSFYEQDLNCPVTKVRQAIEADLAEVNRQMSTYIDSSEISQVNQAEAGQLLSISPWFVYVLNYSLELAKESDGVFDPTIGPLVNLWGFGPEGPKETPRADELAKALSVVGFEKIELYPSAVRKKNKACYLDLSSVAKGYAVDLLSKTLLKFGAKHHLVEIGGELKSQGLKFNQKPWTIGIEHPKSDRRVLSLVQLKDQAIASSGNYRNFLDTKDGRIYHTIDSKTGKPVQTDLISVTVISDECMKADALATTLVAMGSKHAKVFAERHKISALFIIKEEDKLKTFTTASFAKNIEGFSFV